MYNHGDIQLNICTFEWNHITMHFFGSPRGKYIIGIMKTMIECQSHDFLFNICFAIIGFCTPWSNGFSELFSTENFSCLDIALLTIGA